MKHLLLLPDIRLEEFLMETREEWEEIEKDGEQEPEKNRNRQEKAEPIPIDDDELPF